jgi:hypothetical protein
VSLVRRACIREAEREHEPRHIEKMSRQKSVQAGRQAGSACSARLICCRMAA